MQIAALPAQNAPMTGIYTGVADLYQISRPEYPGDTVGLVLRRISVELNADYWIDVGAGTGKFTRPLAEQVGSRFQIFGVEPNEDMIAEANRVGGGKITYLKSPAEVLPFARNSAAVVSAAASAQLFDRPLFYREVERILVKDGVIAFIYNHGRFAESAFLSAYQGLYEANVPGYRRGMFADRFGTFAEVDYVRELGQLPAFGDIQDERIAWTHYYDRASIEARFTSTIHFQQALKNRPRDALVGELHALIDKHIRADGTLEFPFTTYVITARKR